MKQQIYMDYAAATPLADEVVVAMQPYWQEQFYNPSALSLPAKAVRYSLDDARSTVASVIGGRPSEIIFTAGGTEANNLAIFGVTSSLEPSHIVTSAIEHESVLAPMKELAKKGWDITELKPNSIGLITAEQLEGAIKPNTALVSLMYANNEIGSVLPIKQFAQVIAEHRLKRTKTNNSSPLYFHTDAAQAANYLAVNAHRLGVDLMTLNGGKIYGPKQSGVLFVRANVPLQPLLFGGGQEAGRRSGTENVPACVGFATALQQANVLRKDEFIRMSELQKYCFDQIEKLLPTVVINGSQKHRLPNNVHLTVPGADNERLLYGLEDKGIICAAGSACSASREEASHVLLAMGMTEADARASLRLSFGRPTTKAHIDKFVQALKTLLSLPKSV